MSAVAAPDHLTLVVIKDPQGWVVNEDRLCGECFNGLPVEAKTPRRDAHGFETIVRPWTGAPTECTACQVEV